MNYSGFKVKKTNFDSPEKFIRYLDDHWYFLDETWGLCGPFFSKEKAIQGLKEYMVKISEKQSKKIT
jgi:hypothetical protein